MRSFAGAFARARRHIARSRQATVGPKRTRRGPLTLEPLEGRLMLDGSPVITEFMAINNTGLRDENLEYSDWIEIHNPTPGPIDLNGWHLTDDDDALAKWTFPNVTLGSGAYTLVFASNKDRSVAGSQLHTNFKLDGDGEYLALVRPDGTNIAQHFTPEYPEQVADVSYGIADATVIYGDLVSPGARVSYHVPVDGDEAWAPGDDPPEWTGIGFDDSAWTDTIDVDPAGIVIAEIDSAGPNFVEIQNAANHSIDTSGWAVLVNDASGGASAVNAIAWNLSGSVAAGALQYRSDDAGNPAHYWGGNIDWTAGGDGWVMVVDDGGEAIDFVAWGYSAAEIDTIGFDYEVSPGVIVAIAVGDQFSGDGAEVGDGSGGAPGPQEDLISFQSPWYWMHPTNGIDPAGADSNFNTTWMQPPGYNGPAFAGPSPGLFGYGDIGDLSIATNIGTPSSGSRYSAYFRRELTITESMANAGIEILSDDGAVIYLDGVEIARNNIAVADTYGALAIDDLYSDNNARTEDETRTLSIPDLTPGTHWIGVSVHQNQTGSSDLGFDMRLFGQTTGGLGTALQRTGSSDTNTAGDFVAAREPDAGVQNGAIVVPFGETAPATTGVGFSSGSSAFDADVQSDVAAEMLGVNTSLWTRIEFQATDPAWFDELLLRMKYDDGFVAYLNGAEVASRGAPDVLPYNAAATGARSDALAVLAEDFDITEHLFGALVSGDNVLAVHGLNHAAADAGFLILPELIATGDFNDPQYMISPSPGTSNTSGAVGLVSDTAFSVDRGLFTDVFDVEITTKTPGAAIRYTLDGSVPTETYGSTYNSAAITVDTTTTLRAIAYMPGYVSSNVDTQTYIFPEHVVSQDGAGFPTAWGVSGGADYGIDPEIVGTPQNPNPTYYDEFIDGLAAIPTLSLVLPIEDIFANGGLYDQPGSTTQEEATSAEWIFTDGRKSFQVDAGLKMQGGASRNPSSSPKHSMSLRFREQYGTGRLEYPLFEGSSSDEFNSLQLRAMYNNSWIHWDSGQRIRGSMIRDQWARDSLLDMGHEDAGQGDYYHLYINGLYWGVYNVHERQEASHYALYHDFNDDNLYALNSGAAIDAPPVAANTWSNLQSLVANAAADSNITLAEFEQISQKLDVVNLIDYM
ncbi:MAG: lamin tail domain-containing protein, partial [Candidatus Nealsonbacteria bacterium]|nr:lamin tail domain-containing protein [Candidatus Nealsonbacteria bacterium]